MSWFGYLQNKRDDTIQHISSSPTEWEVLSQVGDKSRVTGITSESGSDAGTGSALASDEETLTVIEDEDELKSQIRTLKKQTGASQREKSSLEEQLRAKGNDLKLLKEKSNRAVTRVRAELEEVRKELEKKKGETVLMEQEMVTMVQEAERLKNDTRVAAEESHRTYLHMQLEAKGTRALLEEKEKSIAGHECEKERLRAEAKAANEYAAKLTATTSSLKDSLGRDGERIQNLIEQSRSLEKSNGLLAEESIRVKAQNSQVLAMLGVCSLEQLEGVTTKADLISDTESMKILKRLNDEIFETAAYMADSFTFKAQSTDADDIKEGAFSGVKKVLGPTMVQNLSSIRHDEDPLLVQIACQASMVECCRRIVTSWSLDGSKAEQFIPELYNRIRKSGVQAGSMTGRWRALTRTLIRSTANDRSELFSRLITLIADAVVDLLVVCGCEGTRAQIADKLTVRFKQRISVVITLALRLNEIFGEEITSCDMKATSVLHGVTFMPRMMEDAYEEGEIQEGPPPKTLRVLCTTDLGLQKEVKITSGEGYWQTSVLVQPKVVLESLMNTMPRRAN